MYVSSLRIYPVKSTAAVELAESAVEPWGLAGDRRWMVVDAVGVTVTARRNRRLLLVKALPAAGGGIELTAPGLAPLLVAPPVDVHQVPVTLSRLPYADAAGAAADEW